MPILICKRCGDEYSGDPYAARVCDLCWERMIEVGWSETEIISKYIPVEETETGEDG